MANVEGRVAERENRIAIRERDGFRLLRVGEIDWVESADNYVRLHAGSRSYLERMTLTAAEAALDGRFARVHRRLIVNLDRVERVRPTRGGDHELELENGTRLRMSRTYRDSVLRRLHRLGRETAEASMHGH
ncbi:MAG: LytR/AlgR family response regulator transcription factor [Longimicrobiales bacterium]